MQTAMEHETILEGRSHQREGPSQKLDCTLKAEE